MERMHKNSHEEKSRYLQNLFRLTYIKDVIERNKLRASEEVLDELPDVVASVAGSLSNPTRLSDTFKSVKGFVIKNETISNYDDSYTKIVVTGDDRLPWTDEKGLLYINFEDFLLGNIIELL